jgi:regulator of replication initiation timing
MERMKDLTQQYIEQLNKMIKDLREERFGLEEENKKLKLENADLM